MVRQRSKTGQGKAKRTLSRKDSTGSFTENPTGREEGRAHLTQDPSTDTRRQKRNQNQTLKLKCLILPEVSYSSGILWCDLGASSHPLFLKPVTICCTT